MKKIMFKDKFGLTDAVLQGRKTMTRRLCKDSATNEVISDDVDTWLFYTDENLVEFRMKDGSIKVSVLPYKVGEVVAVAQSYKDVLNELPDRYREMVIGLYSNSKSLTNKMFVRPDLMPHQIRITDINVERLQDISDEDCLKEGIVAGELKHELPKQLVMTPMPYGSFLPFSFRGAGSDYFYAKDAFAALINKVSGKGTWEKNPWVFCYSFELVK